MSMYLINRSRTPALLVLAGVLAAGAAAAAAGDSNAGSAAAEVPAFSSVRPTEAGTAFVVSPVTRAMAAEAGFKLEARGKEVSRSAHRRVIAVPVMDGPPCLVTEGAAGTGLSCATEAWGPIASVGYEGSIGIVPDGVTTISYTMTDGSTRRGSIADGVWKAPLEAEQAAYTANGAAVVVDLMPPSTIPVGVAVDANGVAGPAGAPFPGAPN